MLIDWAKVGALALLFVGSVSFTVGVVCSLYAGSWSPFLGLSVGVSGLCAALFREIVEREF